jgi:SAM-dependent methyltransferase
MESLRSSAPSFVKKVVWDFKHRKSQNNPNASPILDFLASRIGAGESLLDFGCGTGNLLTGLRRKSWIGEYTGVDISPKAIAVAQELADRKSQWRICPAEHFSFDRNYDIICFVESIYYVRRERIQDLLLRCRAHCRRIYIRIWDLVRHDDFVTEIHKFGCVPMDRTFIIKGDLSG